MPDELWEAALEAVQKRGDPSVSHILRDALTRYVKATDRMQASDGVPPQQRSEHDRQPNASDPA